MNSSSESSVEIEAPIYFGLDEIVTPFRAHPAVESVSAKKIALLVLGMHRSGTSSLAGTLVRLGAKAPNTLLPLSADNERGFFESLPIMHLNDEILASAGTVWDDWRAFNRGWSKSGVAAEFEERAVATLFAEFGSAPLVLIKDPRCCRMMPFWSKVFDQAGYDVRILMPVRSPLEVARSLWLRNGFPISKGLLLWLRHVLDAEAASRQHPRAILDWSEFLADWRLAMTRVEERLQLSWPCESDQSLAEIDRFLSPGLRHNAVDFDDLVVHKDVNAWVLSAYKAMIALSIDSASSNARHALDEVRSEFDKASNIFGRALVDFEENVAKGRQQTEIAQLERDAAHSERDRQIEEATRHHQRAEHLAGELGRVGSEATAIRISAETLAANRDALAEERDRLAGEAAALRQQVNLLAAEREALVRERDALLSLSGQPTADTLAETQESPEQPD